MARSRPSLRSSIVPNRSVRLEAEEDLSPHSMALRLGLLVSGSMLMITLVGWLWHIGWPQRQVDSLAELGLKITQHLKFAIHDVVVDGRVNTPRDALINALNTKIGAPILGFDPDTAKDRISALPWVRDVIIERRLPDTLVIRLTERTPLARWQYQGTVILIDTTGTEIPGAKLDDFRTLPLVVGHDAPTHTATLLKVLGPYTAITPVMTAAARVGDRRWDLYLSPGIIAKLPENDVDNALQQLTTLVRDQHILDKDIGAIDLRIDGRIILDPKTSQPTPSSAKELPPASASASPTTPAKKKEPLKTKVAHPTPKTKTIQPTTSRTSPKSSSGMPAP